MSIKKLALGTSLVFLLTCTTTKPDNSHFDSVNPPTGAPPRESDLAKFVDELPIPTSIRIPPNTHDLDLVLGQFKHKFHRDLPASDAWGYNYHTPGPTVEVEKDQVLRIHWRNGLKEKHILPMDAEAGMAEALPEVRAVTHLHGAAVTEPDPMNRQNNNDGWPDAWTTGGQTQLAEYPNRQEAATLWYHDHAMGITGRNVYAGLAGFYLIHDDFERSLRLPTGQFDIPLMLQGRSFSAAGAMIYPRGIPSEVYGNTLTVNGKVWPYLKVEPRRYRFRFLNAANARSVALVILDRQSGVPGPRFYQIGSDGGFLENTVILNDPRNPNGTRLQLAPGERTDVIVDFSNYAGKELRLDNSAVPDDPALGPPIPDVMLFRVGKAASSADTTVMPTKLRPIARLNVNRVATTRRILLTETEMPDGSQMMLLNGKHWADPVTEKPVLGSTEIWELVNMTDDMHPFHLHSVRFQILDRRSFDMNRFRADESLHWTGPVEPPNPNEMGWKDTVVSTIGEVTRIIIKFGPFPGHYVYHCHILEHEDMDMMRPFEIIRAPIRSSTIR